MAHKIFKETFESLNDMIRIIESRPNNDAMKFDNSSYTGDKEFTMTSSYDEAKYLLRYGYKDVLEKMKVGVNNTLKKTNVEQRRRITTNVMGYAPHVPNAILGLPNSMILTERKPQKTKAVSIVVGITENAGCSAETIVNSGVAALSVVNALELNGCRVNLKVAFKVSRMNNERAYAMVKIKDYREHLDLQKICFPMAHPSMFRRFGFKWLETVPGLTNSGWSYGYGQSFHDYEEIKKEMLEDNEYFIDLKITKNCGYDPEKIIKYLNITY